ncbi:hypothetical protein B0H19DRAFT_239316 [Mycena capillaripes]|nr:hypothetical protein B0H19DRAFT_239316 [Mycena capillaripes]
MLSPFEPALAMFASVANPMVVNMVQSLAESSGFPVVLRPPGDNPALTLLVHDAERQNVPVQFGGTNGHNSERRHSRDGEDEEDERRSQESGDGGRRDPGPQNVASNGDDLNTVDTHQRHPSYKGICGDGDGDGGGGGPTLMDRKWDSPLHRIRVKLCLKLTTDLTYAVTIAYTFKFTINRETEIPIDLKDLTQPLSQSEVVALVDFKIETRPRETQVDRSYATIGFVAHRRESINEREFLHRGFDLPDRLYKRGQQRQIQRALKATLGFSQGSPLATANFSYNRNNDVMLEATDSKVMPRCRVSYETGDEWDEGHKSYSSYNIAYQPQDMRLDAERSEFHPLEVKVGMGINLRPAGSEKPLPQISFINRNQVLIWVSDPTSKARIRGIVVMMSSYLDDIQTNKKLDIYEREEIELNASHLTVPTTKEEPHKPGTISVSIAEVQNYGASTLNKLGGGVLAFIAKLGQRYSTPPPTYIPPHEYLARGWDVNNNEWRNVLWPALDKCFRAAALEGTTPVWNIQCQWKQAQPRIAQP